MTLVTKLTSGDPEYGHDKAIADVQEFVDKISPGTLVGTSASSSGDPGGGAMAQPVSSLTGQGVPSPASPTIDEKGAPTGMDVDQGGDKDNQKSTSTPLARFYTYNDQATNPDNEPESTRRWGNYDTYAPEDFQEDNQLKPYDPMEEGPVPPGTKVIDTTPKDGRKWAMVYDNTQHVSTFPETQDIPKVIATRVEPLVPPEKIPPNEGETLADQIKRLRLTTTFQAAHATIQSYYYCGVYLIY